jgi:rod shape-determining protein MreD
MRWITFFILLYLMTAMQVAHFGAIPHSGQPWPAVQYIPLLAIFYALFATDAAAPLAALVCGVAYDLGNYPNDLLGTNLVPLALVAYFVVKIRLSIFREHLVSQALLTLLAMLAFSVLSVIMRLLVQAPLDGGSAWVHLETLAGNAVYTAIVSPALFWVFFRLTPLLGFTSHGPRMRGKA